MRKELEEIAQDIINHSEGSYSIEYPESFEKLSNSDKQAVEDYVGEVVGPCEACGWNWSFDSMGGSNQLEGLICYQCAKEEEAEEEAEEERNAECGECGCTYEYLEMNLIDGDYVCDNCEEEETL